MKRKIRLTFELGTGSFGETGKNILTVEDLRVRASIEMGGMPSGQIAVIRVYGMTFSDMAEIMKSFRNVNGQPAATQNKVKVEAGVDSGGYAVMFYGYIREAPIDLGQMPDSCLMISAFGSGFDAVKTAAPTSFPGSAKVSTIVQSIATRLNYGFNNYGVTQILRDQYLRGSLWDQLETVRRNAAIEMFKDDVKQTVDIWPRGKSRGDLVKVVSPQSGMRGYPIPHPGMGFDVTTMFDSEIQFGGKVKIESSLPLANGLYNTYQVQHELDSEMPNGSWFTSFYAFPAQ